MIKEFISRFHHNNNHFRKTLQENQNGQELVNLVDVVKTFVTTAGTFTALKGVDLQVQRGEFLSIIGKSGSGKSTLINMLTGIDQPTSGELWINGTPIHTLNEEQIALWRGHTIGVIFQFFQLLPTLTAIENIMLPMDYSNRYPASERPQRAFELLERVGMARYAHRMPLTLSGGQRQSIAIARAIANDPPLITADEPTGNLDSKSTELVINLFEDLVAAGKTVLMVTHDNDLAARAHRTVVISDGRIVDVRTNDNHNNRNHETVPSGEEHVQNTPES